MNSSKGTRPLKIPSLRQNIMVEQPNLSLLCSREGKGREGKGRGGEGEGEGEGKGEGKGRQGLANATM